MSFLCTNFDAKKVKNEIVEWIRNWFDENGKDAKAVVLISGGKDSTIVGKLMIESLGKENVIGLLLPNGIQKDINVAIDVVKYLDIKYHVCNIESMVNDGLNLVSNEISVSDQTKINLPPRIRMCLGYAFSQSYNAFPINTSNLSENFIGFSTLYGDHAFAISPLGNLTVSEVKQIGLELEIPNNFINKIPSDGLTGLSDEEATGISYDILDNYIRTGICEDNNIKNKIDDRHIKNLFKLTHIAIETYEPNLPILPKY